MKKITVWLKNRWQDPIWRTALLVFLASRILLSVWMVAVQGMFFGDQTPDPANHPYLGVSPEENPWLGTWQRWDTLHYQAIAEGGYQAFENALFVPPLYPLVMRAGGALLGGNSLLAGMIVGNLAYFAALVALGKLSEELLGGEAAAQRAIVYLAIFPTAYFLLAAYTESIFLLAAIMALWKTGQERWVSAGLWAALACLVRLPGVFLLIPLGLAAIRQIIEQKNWRAMWAPVIGGLGAALFPLYIWLFLKLPPWTPLTVQSARFQGGFTFPGYNILLAIRQVADGVFVRANAIEVFFMLVFLAAMAPVVRRLPWPYGVYYLSLMALYLTRTGSTYPLLAMARYVLVLFPFFIWLAEKGENPWVNRAVVYTSFAGLLFMSAQFAIWGWTG